MIYEWGHAAAGHTLVSQHSALLQAVFMVGFSSETDKLFASANQMASEAFNNIRTVRSQPVEPLKLHSAYSTIKLGPHAARLPTAPPHSAPSASFQVSAFQMEDSTSQLYTKLLGPPTRSSEKSAQVCGVGFGITSGLIYLTCGAVQHGYHAGICILPE